MSSVACDEVWSEWLNPQSSVQSLRNLSVSTSLNTVDSDISDDEFSGAASYSDVAVEPYL